MRKTMGLVAALALGFFAVVSQAEEAKWVKLVLGDGDKVLAIADDSEEAGAKIVVAKDNNSAGQQWKLEKDGDHHKITHRKSGKVLDVESNSTDEGGSIILWDAKDEGVENQRWAWVGEGAAKQLKCKQSGMVLHAGDDGFVIQMKADAAKAKSQTWKAVEVK